MFKKRRYQRRKPQSKWGFSTWILASVGSLLLPLAIYIAFSYNSVTEVTLLLAVIGSFFTGRIFEKTW